MKNLLTTLVACVVPQMFRRPDASVYEKEEHLLNLKFTVTYLMVVCSIKKFSYMC